MRRAFALVILVACSPGPRVRPDGGGADDDDQVTPDAGFSDACAAAEAARSYIGCRYWAVDLQNAIEVWGPPTNGDCASWGAGAVMIAQQSVCVNADGTYAGNCDLDGTCASAPGTACEVHDACGLDAQHSPFAVVIANTGAESADITIRDAGGMTVLTTVAAGATETLLPQQIGFVDHSIVGPGIAAAAYEIVSTQPVVAYQLNPLDDVGVFSNDASLLLPQQTFDTSYIALSYPNFARRPQASDWHGYLTVVATEDTQVEVTPTTPVLAGASPLAIGQPATFTLHRFDTLQLSASTGDLSGTKVTSDKPVAAFSGHEATVIADPFPFRGPCCADHLEEQLYPTSTWGKTFAIARIRERATGIHDYLRIVAQQPSTIVQITPESAVFTTCTGKLLNPGELCDAFITGDVELRASAPVLVGHYMVSGGGISPTSGDPALAFVPPVEQFRKSYTIVVPAQYTQSDLQLVTTTGGSISLDGADITLALAPFGSMAWSAARIQVAAGSHVIECSMGCSIEVDGWDLAVSYMYSGGLDLAPIVL